ncbi:MAG TPA: ATP cone domain-containing protein, partial [Candidatus Hydrogenedentes bacterium]|nr:ATP cone domain-containing protein [Candidatus Hydrogenedentota bacterium]
MIEAKPAQMVTKRDGRTATFDGERILRAIEKAFKADLALEPDVALDEVTVVRAREISDAVINEVINRSAGGEQLEVESIQDAVERHLMKAGYYTVARRYIVYREDRKKARALRGDTTLGGLPQAELHVTALDGSRERLQPNRIRRKLIEASQGYEELVAVEQMNEEVIQTLYDGISPSEIAKACIFAAKARIERDPAYTYVAARLLLNVIYSEVLPGGVEVGSIEAVHRSHFKHYLAEGVRLERLSPDLLEYDLDRISEALDLERDLQFTYMGLQTLYDRYLIHDRSRRIETPQYFWMRVAMGLAMNEGVNREERAIAFYEVMSRFLFTSSTPTLFNAGTLHPQLSSCYLSTIEDDLEHIFK